MIEKHSKCIVINILIENSDHLDCEQDINMEVTPLYFFSDCYENILSGVKFMVGCLFVFLSAYWSFF